MAKKISRESIYNKAMPWWKNEIYGNELLGMRLLRKKSVKEMARVTGEDIGDINTIEKTMGEFPAPPPVAGIYMMYLSCNMNHVYQFRKIVGGDKKDFKESRTIGSKLKKDVYKKCKNRCVVCRAEDNLHIHHVKKYSEGGLNELDNLVLLCPSCHADTHKNDVSYHMLKSAAERGEHRG
ncbi:HNH endonuclease [Alteribacillus persepolensis]|uniref:HNH endonuclease n=1 Tax=Alteribacillus persepolensis TaxID=568899 RepID=A0A1G8IJP7_9BACI|nr:HNH endonuclease signature motif containing protein [Alteribacillus persepolensis]SDI18750.1 HNH endonuclease [Alteribacillus persepolensis]